MANRIQIRHGSTQPTTSDLLPYELGWDGSNLYINNNQASNENCIVIGTILSNGALPLTKGGTGATTAAAARTNLELGSIAVKNITDFFPINYTTPDFSVATTTQGVYPLAGTANPVSNVAEYGGVLQFGGSTTSSNYYGAQLIVSSASGGSSPPHMYIRRMTRTPGWGIWGTILDNANYSKYTVTKTGNGASGTWGISVTGNSATTNKIITASDSTARSIYVTTTNAVPSGAVAGDIVLVKVT